MIVFELKCGAGHRFEAWFRDGAAYETQVAERSVSCPMCGSLDVAKAPMAPRIARGGHAAEERRRAVEAETLRQLAELRATVEKNCDYVGDRFAEEARRIHYGEVDAHGIYGETTADEAKELKDEGVACYQVPWIPRTDS